MEFLWNRHTLPGYTNRLETTLRKLSGRRQVMEFVCQFDVREILGQGSFCEVKRCIDKRTRQVFAVKEMIYDTDELRERIEQEIEVSVSLLVQFMVCMSLVYFKKLRRHTAKISKSKRRLYKVWRINYPLRLKYPNFLNMCTCLVSFCVIRIRWCTVYSNVPNLQCRPINENYLLTLSRDQL